MMVAEEGSAFLEGCQGDEGLGHEVGVVHVALFCVSPCVIVEIQMRG